MAHRAPLHLRGHTWHGRKGPVKNAFRYGVDYVLLDAEDPGPLPALLARNRAGLACVLDRDHGGPPGQGRGAAWVREVLRENGIAAPDRIRLLTQPRVLGYDFNPVSFWLCEDHLGALSCVVAEVTNTFGDRHAYLCLPDPGQSITADSDIHTRKVMHVSPFQPIEGTYRFTFDIRPDRIGIRIDYDRDGGGVIATLTGDLAPLTNRGLIGAALRRPLGPLRVMALIHWQALKLWWKGAPYTTRPAPPEQNVSR